MHSPVRAGCSCGRQDCPAVAKHPRVRWETLMEAPATEADIEAWWRRWPDANVGVVTGRVSGVVVLDVDPRNGGDRLLESFEARWGALPATVEAHTGGGGRHLWLSSGEQLPSAVLAPGLELKAEHAVVTVPPSLHASRGRACSARGRSRRDRPSPRWCT